MRGFRRSVARSRVPGWMALVGVGLAMVALGRSILGAPGPPWGTEVLRVWSESGEPLELELRAEPGIYLFFGGHCLACYQHIGEWRKFVGDWRDAVVVVATARGEGPVLGILLGGQEPIGYLDDGLSVQNPQLAPPFLVASSMGRIVWAGSAPPSWPLAVVLRVLISTERSVRRWREWS